jgi:dimethylaniline monooxygenase (N-oxide forming)
MARIGIIGGGISGLVTARTFLGDGWDVAVLEKDDEVGGVWARSRRYPGIATQNPRDTYAFSDFPMPRSYPEFPSGEQVQAYLAAYADRFGVTPHVRFGTVVEAVARHGEGWTVRTRPADGGAAEVHRFDRIAVCNGVFSEPFTPPVPGLHEFVAGGGTVLHSSQLADAGLADDRRVVVVGYAKSAADVASALAWRARSTALVYRRAGWKMPKRWFGLVPLRYVLTTRSAESLFRYHTLRGAERVLHGIGRPLVWAFWRMVEGRLRASQGLERCGLVPEDRVEDFVGCTLSLETDGFFAHVHAGRIQPHRATIARAAPGVVHLDSGEALPAEVLVFGTGFRQGVPFLDDATRAAVQDADGAFHLYRNLIHPDVPGLGFVGYNSSLYSQLTSEVGARWLAEHFAGRIPLPTGERMLREVQARLDWLRTERPRGTASGTCLIPFNFHYLDDLMGDMGLRTRRAPFNPVREYLLPVDPSLYAGLKDEIERGRRTRTGLRPVADREPAERIPA